MTKYGYESGSIAISQLRAGIDDKNYYSNNIIQIHIFFIPTYTACQAEHNHM